VLVRQDARLTGLALSAVLLVFGVAGIAGIGLTGLVTDRRPRLASAACAVTLTAALAVPWLAVRLARRACRGIAQPLRELMSAADEGARDNRSVRVPVDRPGEFSRLAQSFNHMTAELQRADQRRHGVQNDVLAQEHPQSGKKIIEH